jgi:hypothetical protein
MKEIILFVIGMGCGSLVMAQTLSEWFHQKKTQIKYLKQQILALKAYKDIAEKGYQIAAEGLGDIGKVKEEDLGLHEDHFEELFTVNPAIRADARVTATLALLEKTLKNLRECEKLTIQYRPALAERATKLREENESICLEVKDYMDQLLSDGNLTMSDADRLDSLERMYRTVQYMYRSSISWVNSVNEMINK